MTNTYSIFSKPAVFLAFALLSGGGPWAARAGQLDLGWSRLGGTITGERVGMVLPGGASIEGRVLSVDADGLSMNVTKTSDTTAYPKGRVQVPRSSVSVLQWKRRGKLWRIVGVSAGAVVGLGLAAMVAMASLWDKDTSSEKAVAAGAIIGFPVAGYFLGRSADGKTTLIRIVPEP